MFDAQPKVSKWSGAWVDALAFGGGLALAWFGSWKTADLVWSLWLSSLVVGYALIVWNVSTGFRTFVLNATQDRTLGFAAAKWGGGLVFGGGALLMVAFFTVHFGGFHVVHSVFLAQFFPLADVQPESGSSNLINLPLYAEVFQRYWIFLPLAFMAERAAFRAPAPEFEGRAITPHAMTLTRKPALGGSMMAPYKNVIRMHLLIFFFAAAHVARFEGFLVYAVVYAAYFFPWHILKKAPVT